MVLGFWLNKVLYNFNLKHLKQHVFLDRNPLKQCKADDERSTWSLTKSRGSLVAGPMSRSRVQSRGRGFKVAVAGSKSRSRVQCRGRGK